MFDCSLKMTKQNRLSQSCAPSASASKNRQAKFSGMTLVELLVVIVILTTLVGGVIPILSPNNDSRKINTAATGLQTYITVTKANAARTGRPHGIAFRESTADSGVALEVFGIEVPPPFAGFSSASAVRLIQAEIPAGSKSYRYYLQFILADSSTGLAPSTGSFPPSSSSGPDDYAFDPAPPNFLKLNDTITIAGREFWLTDTDDLTEGVYTATKSLFRCKFDRDTGSTLAFVQSHSDGSNEYRFTAPKRYKIHRQPVNSAGDPFQLPASVAIDMQGSVAEGGNNPAASPFPIPSSLFTNDTPAIEDLVGIMFSPTGAVSRVFVNSTELTSVSRVVLLLGRIENGGLSGSEWTISTTASDEDLKEQQEKINWLNLDSRLLSIVSQSGRVVVSKPAFVDARRFGADTATEQAEEQIEAAHEFAHEMTTAK